MELSDTLNLLLMEARLDPSLDKFDTNTLMLILTRTNLLSLVDAASEATHRWTDFRSFNFGAFIDAMLTNIEWIDKNIEGVEVIDGEGTS